MARLKTVEYIVAYVDSKILIEDIVDKYVNNHIGEGARLIGIDSDGAVFEWLVPMTDEEIRAEAEAERIKQEKIDTDEAVDRKAGF